MTSLSYNIDTSYKSKQESIREPIEKIDMTNFNSIMSNVDKIMDENNLIMNELETSKNVVVKKLSVVKKQITAQSMITDNKIILLPKKSQNAPIASSTADANKNTQNELNIIEKLNIVNYVELERKKIRYNQMLYLRYLQTLKRIRIEEIERHQIEYMFKLLNKFTFVKLTGTVVAVGISMLLISSITSPSTWILIGKTMTQSPFTFQLFTDIFYNFGIFNLSDVANVSNLFQQLLLNVPNNPLLANNEYINAVLKIIFTPITKDGIASLKEDQTFKILNLEYKKDLKVTDILNKLKGIPEFAAHDNDNALIKLFLTLFTIINGKNIFDPNKQLSLENGWFQFVANSFSSPHMSFFLTTCKLAYNVIGYVNTTVDVLQNAPNIDPSIILKSMSLSGLASVSFSSYTNIISTNFVKHIVGNKLDDVFISTILGDLTGNTINGFFITTINGLIQTEVTSRIRGYFVKIETEAGYKTAEQRLKLLKETSKDPLIETELLIRKIGKGRNLNLTNEEIMEAIYPDYDKESEYKSFLFKNLHIFYKNFKKVIKKPETFLYALMNVSVIYNGLVNIFYTGIFGGGIYIFQRLVLTGWAEHSFFRFKISSFEINATILNFISYIIPAIIGSDQYILNKFSLLKRQLIADLVQDIDTLITNIQDAFFNTKIGMSVNKFLRKVNNFILGSLFTTSCKVIYKLIFIPQFQQMLNTNIPEFKIKIAEFIKDSDKVYKFFAFLNHRIDNIYNIYYTTTADATIKDKLMNVWKELHKIGQVGTFINENFIPYVNAENIINYDELSVSNLKGNLINVLDEDEKCKNQGRIIDIDCIEKKYIIVNRDLDDNYDVIDYNDIKTGLKEKIKDIPIDIVLRSELPETLFYRYYYTKFINIKTSENSKYIFKLNDFKTYMLKEAEKIRRDNNSKPAGEISIEYGVINSVILTIEQKFNTSFLNDMGLSSNENYDESNFRLLPKVLQENIQDFLINGPKTPFKKEQIKKHDMLKDNVVLTIFTPNSYGHLPQTIKANDFYNFKDILIGLNKEDLVGDATTKLSELEFEAENNYELKSDLALLNANFKAPCRVIYRNIAQLDAGFIKRFPDQDINLPLNDLGFDYAIFKEKFEGLIQNIENKPNLDDSLVARFLVKLLDIDNIKITDNKDDYSEELMKKIYTPETLIKLSLLKDNEIDNAIQFVISKEKKLDYISPDIEQLKTVSSYLKTLVKGIITIDNKVKDVYDIMYEVIESQDKKDKPELEKLYLVLKEMIPKMHQNEEIKNAIKSYFSYIISPLERSNIVEEAKKQLEDTSNIKADIREIKLKDNLKEVELSDPNNQLPGGKIPIEDLKPFFTIDEEKQNLERYLVIVNEMIKIRKKLLEQADFNSPEISIEPGKNADLDRYKELRKQWLDKSLEIYSLFRKKQAFLLYKQINDEREIVNKQIKDQMDSYLKRLNSIYLKFVVSKKKPVLTQKMSTGEAQKPTAVEAQKPTVNVQKQAVGVGIKKPAIDPQQQMRLNELVKNQVKNAEVQAYKEALGIAEEFEEKLDEEVKYNEEIGLQNAFGGDSIFQTFFSFFSDMLNKFGSPNIKDAEIVNPEDVEYKELEKKEKNAVEVCEDISGKWYIYEENYKINDFSIDTEDARRCNQVNLGEQGFRQLNMNYKITMTTTVWRIILGTITALLTALGLMGAASAPASGAAAASTAASTINSAGIAVEFLTTISLIAAVGSVSSQGALLLINYVFIYTFSNSYVTELLDNKYDRKTNFAIKILFSLWYRYYKNLMKLYTTPGTNQIDYDAMCNEFGCTVLKGNTFATIPMTYQAIDEEADRILLLIYNNEQGGNIMYDPKSYNLHGDIDLGQKTNDINYSNLKELLPRFLSSNFITNDMKVKYDLLVDQSKTSLTCGDLEYSKENLKIAIYSFFQNKIDSKKPSFLYDFIFCNLFGNNEFSLLGLFSNLWHIIVNPEMFMKITKDIFSAILLNKEMRPFILTYFLGKESKGININAIRDIIDKEIIYIEELSKINGEVDMAKFEEIFEKSLTWKIPEFFALYFETVSKIYHSIFGKEDETKINIKKWDLHDDFLSCLSKNCNSLHHKFVKVLDKIEKDVIQSKKDEKDNTEILLDTYGNSILDANGNKILRFDRTKINDEDYILSYINSLVPYIEKSDYKLLFHPDIKKKAKENEPVDGEDYLRKYCELLKNYRQTIKKRKALDIFIKSKITSANNPFLNFALKNYLETGYLSSALANDLIYICNTDEILAYDEITNEYSCSKIDISNNYVFDTEEYSERLNKERRTMLSNIYSFITDINDINQTISNLCYKEGLCDKIEGSKDRVKKFLDESIALVLQFRSGTDSQETMFLKLQQKLEEYKEKSKPILRAFEKQLLEDYDFSVKLAKVREDEYNDPDTNLLNKAKIWFQWTATEKEVTRLRKMWNDTLKKLKLLENIKAPDDIKDVNNFEEYFYLHTLEKIDVNKDPKFFAYMYLSYFQLNSYGLTVDDLKKIHDEFNSDNVNISLLKLSNGRIISFTGEKYSSLNENLQNKDVKEYIKYYASSQIKEIGQKSEFYINERNTNLQIKKKGELIPTPVKSTSEFISALSSTIQEKDLNVLFKYGYYLHKEPFSQNKPSRLILSKTWPKDIFGNPETVINRIIEEFSGDKSPFVYNSQNNYNSDNKFDGAPPPILIGLNIDSKDIDLNIKKFIQNNYVNIEGIWVMKQDIELYKVNFKDFDEKKFIESIRDAISKRGDIKKTYFEQLEVNNAEQANKLKQLEKEKNDLDEELKQAAEKEKILNEKKAASIKTSVEGYKTDIGKLTTLYNNFSANKLSLQKDIKDINNKKQQIINKDKTLDDIVQNIETNMNMFVGDLNTFETKFNKAKDLFGELLEKVNNKSDNEIVSNLQDIEKLIDDINNIFLEFPEIENNINSKINEVKEDIIKADEQIEYLNSSWWKIGMKKIEKGVKKVATGAEFVIKSTSSALGSLKDKTYSAYKSLKDTSIKDVLTSGKNALTSIKSSYESTKSKIAQLANNIWWGSLTEQQQRHLDTFIGVEFTGFDELEVNINQFSDLTMKFGNLKQLYEFGAEDNGIYNPNTNNYGYFSKKEQAKNNFVAVFNTIFSPHVLGKPFSNGYYDVNTGNLFYNSEGMKLLDDTY